MCITLAHSLSIGCPVTGNLASGNNGLPNPREGSKTIAIVDAYDYPTAYDDLTVFSKQFGLPVLPQCSAAHTTGCFESGDAGTKPATNGSWALEAALDIEWAHAVAARARIVLVEAASDRFSDLFHAVCWFPGSVVAQGGGSGEVSMSWGGCDFRGESAYDLNFQTLGVV